jgi:hypothetical protein
MPEFPFTLPFTLGGTPSITPTPGPATGQADNEDELSPEWGEGPWPGVHPSSTDRTKRKRPEWLNKSPNFLHWLVEHILRATLQSITGIFVHGPLGTAHQRLQEWSDRLEARFGNLRLAFQSLFGHDPIEGDFPILEAIHRLIDNLLPAGRLAELFNGRLKDGQEPGALLETWKAMWDNVFGPDSPDDSPIERTVHNFRDAVQALLHRQADTAGQAETALHLLNFGANHPIFGSPNPTMKVNFGIGHLRKVAVSGSVVTVDPDPWNIACTQTVSRGAFDRFDRSADFTLLQFKVKKVGTVSAAKAHVWRMNPATGDIAWQQAVAINPAGLPTANFDYVNLVLSPPIHTESGDVLSGEMTSTGSGSILMAGIDTPWLRDDPSARPKRWGWSRAVNADASPPATIADASVTYSGDVPYMGFGQVLGDLPAPKYVYTDGFDSVNQWTGLAGSFIFTGICSTGSAAANCMLFLPATYSDDSSVEFDLRARWSILNPSFNNGDKIRLMMHCSSNLSQSVGLEIESNVGTFTPFADNSIRIITGTSVLGTPTVRSGDATLDNNYAGRLSIQYNTPANTYSVFIGPTTTPALTWLDSGHFSSHGPGFRQAALYANYSQYNQAVCDNFSYRDL